MISRTFFFTFILFLSGAWFFFNKARSPIPSSNENRQEIFQEALAPGPDNSQSNAFQRRPRSSPFSAPELRPPTVPAPHDPSSKKSTDELNSRKCLSQWGGWSKLASLMQEALHEPGRLPELSNFEFDGMTPHGAQRLQLRRESQGKFSTQFFALDEEDLPLPLGERMFHDQYPETWLHEVFQNQALKSQERAYVITSLNRETHLTLLSEGPNLSGSFRILDLEVIQDGRVLACSDSSRLKNEKTQWTCTCR